MTKKPTAEEAAAARAKKEADAAATKAEAQAAKAARDEEKRIETELKDAQKARTAGHSRVGFLAVSPTGGPKDAEYPGRSIHYGITPGFDQTGPRNDLRTRLAGGGDWVGHVIVMDNKTGVAKLELFDEDDEAKLDAKAEKEAAKA